MFERIGVIFFLILGITSWALWFGSTVGWALRLHRASIQAPQLRGARGYG